MDDDELSRFKDYLSEQVEDLRRNVDAWLSSRSVARGIIALGEPEVRKGGWAPAPVEAVEGAEAGEAARRPQQGDARGEPHEGMAQLAVRRALEACPSELSAGGRAAAGRARRAAQGGLGEASSTGNLSEASLPEDFAHGSQSDAPCRRATPRASLMNSRRDSATAESLGLKSLKFGRGVRSASVGAALSSAASRKILNASTASIRLGAIAIFKYFMFDWLFTIVTILNVVAIGLSAEVAPAWIGWMAVDAVFAVLFTVEMLMRMRETGVRQYFLGDDLRFDWRKDGDLRWRLFEFALIALAYADLGLSFLQRSSPDEFTILRSLRLTRIARVLRVCRLSVFTELVMMINGAIGGVRTLVCSLALIAIPLYAVALVMRESLGSFASRGGGAETFSTLPLAWFTMFRCTVAGDCTTAEGRPVFLLVSEEYGWAYGLLFCLTTIIMSFGMYNTIAAIFVENTLAAARCNTVLQKRQRLLDRKIFSEKAAELIQFMWGVHKARREDPRENLDAHERVALLKGLEPMEEGELQEAANLQITPSFFDFLLQFREFKVILEELDVSDEDQIDMFDTLDVDGEGTIDIEAMIVGIARLRGEARRADIIGVSLVVRAIQAEVKQLREAVAQSARPRAAAPKAQGAGAAPRS